MEMYDRAENSDQLERSSLLSRSLVFLDRFRTDELILYNQLSICLRSVVIPSFPSFQKRRRKFERGI